MPILRVKIAILTKKLRFRRQFRQFVEMSLASTKRFELSWADRWPFLYEETAIESFDQHYVYHTGWAARILAKTMPSRHVDISSSLYFATLVSAFVPVDHYDFRPPSLSLTNLSVQKADLQKLPFADHSISSLSCMHVVEHVGLGRYGDPLDPDGDLGAIAELKRVLSFGGSLLFVVPVGAPKIMFNAHRIYSYEQILEYLSPLQLKDFSLVTDDGEFVRHADRSDSDRQTYGCGCFWFEKKKCS